LLQQFFVYLLPAPPSLRLKHSPRLAFETIDPYALVCIERRAGEPGIDREPRDCCCGALDPHEGTHNLRASFETEPLTETHGNIDNGPFKELARAADPVPPQASQPEAVVQVVQEPPDVSAVSDHHVDMLIA
jgi:hypothetical protein